MLSQSGREQMKSNWFILGTSYPTPLGWCLRKLLSDQAIHFIRLNQPIHQQELASALPDLPSKLDDWTQMKKKFLVWVRRHLIQRIDLNPPISQQTLVQILRADNPHCEVTFNLVLTGSSMILVPITPHTHPFHQVVNWVMVKHVMLSGYSSDVRFAGELTCKSGRLILNRNSGTYRPNERRLEAAAAYLSSYLGISIHRDYQVR